MKHMNKLMFLTSTGLPVETRNYFLEILPKKPEELKVAFIPTAADLETDKWFVKAALDQLTELKFPVTIIDLKDDPFKIKLTLENSDIIYVNGGNTFYLMEWIRKSGVDKYVKELIDRGKIYVGGSAGAIITGPSIELAGWSSDGDKNEIGLKDFKGLNIVPFAVYPHYTDSDKELFSEKEKTVKYPVIPISNSQAILFQNDLWKIVGV